MARNNYFSSFESADRYLKRQKTAGLVSEQGTLSWDGSPMSARYKDYRDRINASETVGTKAYDQLQGERAELWKHLQEHGRFYTVTDSRGTALHWEGTDARGRRMKGSNNFLGRTSKKDAKVGEFFSASGVGLRDNLSVDNFTRSFASGYEAILGKKSVRSATTDERAAIQTFGKIRQARDIVAAGKDAFNNGYSGGWFDPKMYSARESLRLTKDAEAAPKQVVPEQAAPEQAAPKQVVPEQRYIAPKVPSAFERLTEDELWQHLYKTKAEGKGNREYQRAIISQISKLRKGKADPTRATPPPGVSSLPKPPTEGGLWKITKESHGAKTTSDYGGFKSHWASVMQEANSPRKGVEPAPKQVAPKTSSDYEGFKSHWASVMQEANSPRKGVEPAPKQVAPKTSSDYEGFKSHWASVMQEANSPRKRRSTK